MFDLSQGTLESANLLLELTSFTGTLTYTNPTSADRVVIVDAVVRTELLSPSFSGSLIDLTTTDRDTGTIPANGGATFSFSDSDYEAHIYETPSSLAPFVGTGLLQFEIKAWNSANHIYLRPEDPIPGQDWEELDQQPLLVGLQAEAALTLEYTFTPTHIPEPIAIDIRPGAFPNRINLESKGTVPVAVLTTAEFDASWVDPSTVWFAGASPTRWTMKDVDGDGHKDMLFQFLAQELVELDKDSTEATLTGTTTNGIGIQGTDEVTIVTKGKK